MPKYFNPTIENISFRGKLLKAEKGTDIDCYLPPHILSKVQLISDEPKVVGPVIEAMQLTDCIYDIPYVTGLIVVNIIAQTNVTFSFGDAGVTVDLFEGEVYKTMPTSWEYLGKVSISGTAYIVTERGE